MSKVQVCIFFDGTGNNGYNVDLYNEEKFSASNYKYSSYAISKSNIFRLYEMYVSNPKNKENIAIYVEGIGTQTGLRDNDVAKALGKVFRRSDEEIVFKGVNTFEDHYQSIKNKFKNFFSKLKHSAEMGESLVWGIAHYKGYCADDKLDNAIEALCDRLSHHIDSRKLNEKIELDINIFGFSRGAALARHFANRINDKNSTYSKQINLTVNLKKKFYENNLSLDHKLNFVGIFDTVESFKNFKFNTDIVEQYSSFQQNLEHLNCHVYHLTAANECRKNFSLTSVFNDQATRTISNDISTGSGYKIVDGYRKIELCLPGCHSDIGGGYKHEISEEYTLANKELPKNSGNLDYQLTKLRSLDNWKQITKDNEKVKISDDKITAKRSKIDGHLQYVNLLLMAEAASKLGKCSLSNDYMEFYKEIIKSKMLDKYYKDVAEISASLLNVSDEQFKFSNIDYAKYNLDNFIHLSSYVDNFSPRDVSSTVIQAGRKLSSTSEANTFIQDDSMRAIYNNENYSMCDELKHPMIANDNWERKIEKAN